MIKMASGVVAKVGSPRGLMWVMMAIVAIGAAAALWMSYMSVPLIVWLLLNGALVLIFASICGEDCYTGGLEWKDIDRPLAIWALMSEWSSGDRPSWLRLIAWTLMIPAEIMATFAIRPATLAVRALLKPMPGEWD